MVGMGYLSLSTTRLSMEERGEGVRQKPPEELPQPIRHEALGGQRQLQIQPIAIELGNSAGRYHHTFRIPVLNDIQGEEQGVDKPGSQSVVFSRGKCEEVDVLLFLRGGGVRADDLASRGGNGDSE